MKNLILIPLLLVSTVAFAGQSANMEVIDVQEFYTKTNVSVPTEVNEQQCYNQDRYANNGRRPNSRGLLEYGVNGGFGSTGGLIGTATGVAIIDELGGNDAAKILGGLLGNKIGNDISDKKRRSNHNNKNGVHCEMVTRVVYVRQQQNVLSHYVVTVTDGYNEYDINRQAAPFIGETIRVNVSVW